MTRRSKRRERRDLHRLERQLAYCRDFDSFDNLTDFTNLYESAQKAGKGVSWKASVQKYLVNIFFRTVETQEALIKRQDIRKGFIEFNINERGKERHIKSVHFSERVVQKCLCSKILYPIFTRSLIYDNGASQKYKGTSFAIKRLETHLRNHYKKFGNKGYILLIDFKSYFENVNHDILKNLYRKYIHDKDILKYTDDFVDAFGEKGIGLGSETSQLHAILYPNPADHFIKDVLSIKGYGRYMDDNYIICEDKNKLKEIYQIIKNKYKELDIKINEKKTHIAELRQGFVFLKTRFYLTDSGKLIKKPLRKYITYERKKLNRLKKQNIDKDTLYHSYISWNGAVSDKNSNKTKYEMLKLIM